MATQLPKTKFAIISNEHGSEEDPYWELFDTLEDAVSESARGTEEDEDVRDVYTVKFRRLGKYKLKTEPIKIGVKVKAKKSKTKRSGNGTKRAKPRRRRVQRFLHNK